MSLKGSLRAGLEVLAELNHVGARKVGATDKVRLALSYYRSAARRSIPRKRKRVVELRIGIMEVGRVD